MDRHDKRNNRDKHIHVLGSQFPAIEHLPATFDVDHLTATEVLRVIQVALAQTKDADVYAKMHAQVALEEAFARGSKAGFERGRREGYTDGYAEGHADGRREALDERAAELAETATLKAAATARKAG